MVHPNTGDAYADHAEHALWLGRKLELRLDILRQLAQA
ncbi:MAG: DOPA 4,5-dioxygenase family protein [Candidatus Binataceae bacterium]